MIYLKNIREKQTVYIPRTEINSKVVVIKSYDEGYADGIVEGKKLQKIKLTNLTVSENGVYKREDGWNEIKVDVEIPENIGNTQEKTLIVTKDISVVLPDADYDAMTKVSVNATQYGQDKRNEGIAIQKSKLTNLSVTANGTYERTDGWNKINVNVSSQPLKLQQKNITLTKDIETVTPSTGYDGLTKVGIDATFYVKTKRDEGYAEGHLQGKTEGYTEGKVEGYTDGKADGIEEGYNQGYADGKAEGTCVLTDLNASPSWDNRDSNNCVTYNPNDYDSEGFSSVKINIGEVYNVGYQEGITKSQEPEENILLVKTGRKFTYTDFDKLVSWFDFKGYVNMKDMFEGCEQLTVLPPIDTSIASNMEKMFSGCTNLTSLPQLNTVGATNMSWMFSRCYKLETIPLLNTSNVKKMDGMFHICRKLETIPQFDTSSVESMKYLVGECTSLKSIPALNAGGIIYWDGANIFGDTDLPNLTEFGGFIGLKKTSIGDTGLVRCPNLSYQSCINVLNGLYDFTGKNTKPLSEQGRLQVHPNFLSKVGDEISIATNKGWTITA